MNHLPVYAYAAHAAKERVSNNAAIRMRIWFAVIALASGRATADTPSRAPPLTTEVAPKLGEPRPPPPSMWHQEDSVDGIIVRLAPRE